MKTELTKEQSQHLIDLGVPKEKASEFEPFDKQDDGVFIFTLTDLLKILPKEIKTEDNIYRQTMLWGGFSYFVGYRIHDTDRWLFQICLTKELIDALYELTIWCIENGYLKFD